MKGILFKPDMLRATIEKRKTVTRRLSGLEAVNGEPDRWKFVSQTDEGFVFSNRNEPIAFVACRPRYLPGETVYLKEGWRVVDAGENSTNDFAIVYPDGELKFWRDNAGEMNYPIDERPRSPMFMPEKYARYHVKIKSVRPERVQEITDEDAAREGCTVKAVAAPGGFFPSDYRSGTLNNGFAKLWNSINAKPKLVKVKGILDHYVSYPWESGTRTETYRGKPHYIRGNPFVWRIEYERVG